MGVTVSKDDTGNIKVTYPYNPAHVMKIKTVPGRTWHPEGKCWTFPFSERVLNQIPSAFAGEEVDEGPGDCAT